MAESSERVLTPDEATFVGGALAGVIGAIMPAPRAAVTWPEAARLASDAPDGCDKLAHRRDELATAARNAFCTNLAEVTAEALCRFASSHPAIIPLEDT